MTTTTATIRLLACGAIVGISLVGCGDDGGLGGEDGGGGDASVVGDGGPPPDDGGATIDGATSDAGPSTAGFTPEDGFAVTGDFVHGGVVTVVSAAAALGAREHELPWLWDITSAQYLGGDDQDAYAGLADGQPITTDIWENQTLYSGWDTPEHHFAYTSSAPLRHARVAAEYANFASGPTDPENYSKLAWPAWPSGWGSQENEQMYLSWWQRVSGTHPGYPQDSMGNGGEDKPLRFGDTEERGLGEMDITVAGLTARTVGHGDVKSWGAMTDPGDRWHRFEFFVDRVVGIADLFIDGDLQIGSSWAVRPSDGGEIEFRPADQYLYVADPTPGCELDSSTWRNVTVHWLGFDDGGLTQGFAPGRNVEVSEIYLDVTRARLELSDAATWEISPEAGRTSEVQGRVRAWSASEIEIELNQGAFAGLGGLYLWLVRDDGSAVRVGRFDP